MKATNVDQIAGVYINYSVRCKKRRIELSRGQLDFAVDPGNHSNASKISKLKAIKYTYAFNH